MTTRGELKARIEALITAFEASQRVEPAGLLGRPSAFPSTADCNDTAHGPLPCPPTCSGSGELRRTRRRTTSACS